MDVTAYKITPAQLRWFRLRRSGLVEPFASAEETASRLVGVQAQMPTSGHIAFWNRTGDCSLADLERARLERRTLVRFWGQRNTVHVYSSEDWPWLHTVFAPRQTVMQRKLAEAGLAKDFRRLTVRIAKRLAEGRQLTYKDVRSKKLEEAQDKWVVSYAVFMALVREGVTCHGPDLDGKSSFVHRAHWTPRLEWSPPDPQTAYRALALRYLEAYGPARARDLAFWYGTTITEARRWLASADDAINQVQIDGQAHWCRRADLKALAETPPGSTRWPVRLLHRFDPLLLGTKDKSWLIDEAHYKQVWRAAAHVEPVLLVAGCIAGTWRYDRKRSGLQVTLRPFAPLGRGVARGAERQAAAIAALFGLELARLTIT